MWPLIAPLMPGIIQGASGLIGGFMSSQQSGQNTAAQIQAQEKMQQQTEQFNAQQAQINRDFQAGQVGQQEQFQTNMVGNQQAYESAMSNSAYQRASADMKAAGLNPMMMFGSGSAAGTPSVAAPSGSSASGSSASVGTPTVPLSQKTSAFGNLGRVVEDSVNTAVQAKLFDKMTEAVATQKAETGYIAAKTATELRQPELIAAQIASEKKRPGLIEQQTGLADEQKQSAQKDVVGKDYSNIQKRNEAAMSTVDLHKAMLYDDILQNPLTAKVVQGGMLGSSVSQMTGPVKDLLDSALMGARVNTAKKELAARLAEQAKSQHSSTKYTDKAGNVTGGSATETWRQ